MIVAEQVENSMQKKKHQLMLKWDAGIGRILSNTFC